MLSVFQACMNIKRVLVFVIQRRFSQEFNLADRYFVRDQVTCGVKIRLRLRPQRTASVLRKSLVTSGRRLHPNRVGAVKKVEQHLFVVSPQTDDLFRILFTKAQNVFDTSGHIRTAIDQVAKKNERVCQFVSREQIEQVQKLGATTVDVANDEGFHMQVRSGLRHKWSATTFWIW